MREDRRHLLTYILVLTLLFSSLIPVPLTAESGKKRASVGPLMLNRSNSVRINFATRELRPYFTIELEDIEGSEALISIGEYGGDTHLIIMREGATVGITVRTYTRRLHSLKIAPNSISTFKPAPGVNFIEENGTIVLEEVGAGSSLNLGAGKLIFSDGYAYKTAMRVVYSYKGVDHLRNIPVVVCNSSLFESLASISGKYNVLSYMAFLSNVTRDVILAQNRTREDSVMLVFAVPVKGYKLELELGRMRYKVPAPFSSCKARQVEKIRTIEETISEILNELKISRENVTILASRLRGSFHLISNSLEGLLSGRLVPSKALADLKTGIERAISDVLELQAGEEFEMSEESFLEKISDHMERNLPVIYGTYRSFKKLESDCDVPWRQYYTGPILLVMSLATLILFVLTFALWGTRHRRASIILGILFILMLIWTSGIAVNYGWHVSLTP